MAKKTTSRKATTGKKKPAQGRAKKPATKRKPATRSKSNKGGSFPWSIVFAAVITFIIGVILVIVLGDKIKVNIPDDVSRKKTPITKVVKSLRKVSLYFSSKDGKSIKAQSVKIKTGSTKAEATAIIKLLIKGLQKGSSLENPIPKGTRLLSVRISNNTATIDFSKELKLNHPGGSSAELQTIYAIVNSITLNMSEISTVRILIDGKRHDTLAGHILIRLPLASDKKIISK
jgi:hypothetical protein